MILHSPFFSGRRRKRRRLDEFELIRELTTGLVYGPEVVLGPGDDASAVRSPTGNMLLLQTTDLLVEDVDFRKGWGTPWMVGIKAATANLSDIAAMGGRPRWAHLALAVPSSWTQKDIYDLTLGFTQLAEEHNVALVGGDLSSTQGPLVISVMVSGEVSEPLIIRRSGAKPGDVIWVSGTLGDAAGGLKLFQAGAKRLSQHFEFAFLKPQPQVKLGMVCAESRSVRAMIDISDGLAGDLGHILEASQVGALIEEKKLPVARSLRTAARQHGWDLLDLVLRGGEDYELLGCTPPDSFDDLARLVKEKADETIFAIGRVTEDRGLKLIRAKGKVEEVEPRAYEHVI